VTVFLAPLIFGPPIHVVKDLKHINFSTNSVYAFYDGSSEVVPPTVFPAYVSFDFLSFQRPKSTSILPYLAHFMYFQPQPNQPSTNFQIDVRDLALLHLQSVTNPAAANKRFVIGQPLSFQQIADVLKGIPALKERLAKDGDGEPNLVFPRMETESFEAAFHGWRYREKEETFFDQAARLLELEGKLGK
jgi:hypothetical protein